MRKRTIGHFFDSFMWYLIYLFPLIFLICGVVLNTDGMSFFNDFVTWFEVTFSDNFIFDALSDLFGADGILPMFIGNWSFMIYYATYFVSCMLLHLAVDTIVFIPRLAHKYMGCFTREEE